MTTIKEGVAGARLPEDTAGVGVGETGFLDKPGKAVYNSGLRSTQVETTKSMSHSSYGGDGKAPRETTQEGVPVQEARKEFGEFLASFTSAPISVS